MDFQELDEKLHQVEEFEQRSYFEWQRFCRTRGYEQADEAGQARIRRQWEEEHWQRFSQSWKEQPIVLTYAAGRSNELIQPADNSEGRIIFHSRALKSEDEGIQKWMMIQKHPRYGVTFEHSHSFVEINYCYSGTITNYVNDRPYVMHEGDLMIMEPGCHHSMGLPLENDILINFVFFPNAMATLIDKVIPGDSRLSRFLMAALERGFGKNNYVSLHAGEDPQTIRTMKEILCEYIEQGRVASEAIIGYLVQEMFARLWRLSEERPELVEYGYQPDNKAVQILAYIREHAVDCTRESVAEHFGYSGSRISNLLTEQFGKSFVALRNEIRLEMIEKKLKTTDLPVQAIAEEYGIGNQTHFYRMYKDHFGRLPRQSAEN